MEEGAFGGVGEGKEADVFGVVAGGLIAGLVVDGVDAVAFHEGELGGDALGAFFAELFFDAVSFGVGGVGGGEVAPDVGLDGVFAAGMPDGGEVDGWRDRVELDGQDSEDELDRERVGRGGFDGGGGGVGAGGGVGRDVDVEPPAGAHAFLHVDGVALDEEPGHDEVFPVAVGLLAGHAVGVADEAEGDGRLAGFFSGGRPLGCEIAHSDFELMDILHGVEVDGE